MLTFTRVSAHVPHPNSWRATVAVCPTCHPSSETNLNVATECSFHFMNAMAKSGGSFMDLLDPRMNYSLSLGNMGDLLLAGGNRE